MVHFWDTLDHCPMYWSEIYPPEFWWALIGIDQHWAMRWALHSHILEGCHASLLCIVHEETCRPHHVHIGSHHAFFLLKYVFSECNIYLNSCARWLNLLRMWSFYLYCRPETSMPDHSIGSEHPDQQTHSQGVGWMSQLSIRLMWIVLVSHTLKLYLPKVCSHPRRGK